MGNITFLDCSESCKINIVVLCEMTIQIYSIMFYSIPSEARLMSLSSQLTVMEACLAPGCPDLDLTEDLAQQLEDIISTYQEEESPPDQDQEEGEEVPPTKETPGSRKEQKLEKKLLKNLGEKPC